MSESSTSTSSSSSSSSSSCCCWMLLLLWVADESEAFVGRIFCGIGFHFGGFCCWHFCTFQWWRDTGYCLARPDPPILIPRSWSCIVSSLNGLCQCWCHQRPRPPYVIFSWAILTVAFLFGFSSKLLQSQWKRSFALQGILKNPQILIISKHHF